MDFAKRTIHQIRFVKPAIVDLLNDVNTVSNTLNLKIEFSISGFLVVLKKPAKNDATMEVISASVHLDF